jgi:hypothetical protein
MADVSAAQDPAVENPAYPRKLQQAEVELLRKRRGLGLAQAVQNVVGFGLSGGGIRSATFCLGIFQGLAHRGLLSSIDYLSTVSGGGYFGAFYGRLFTRAAVTSIADVEDILRVRAANEEEAAPSSGKLPKGKVFRWLRENGRYLAPSGSGDVLVGGAAMLRNFVAVHVVLWTFILMIFLAAQALRGGVELVCEVGSESPCAWWALMQEFLSHHMPGGQGLIWWSPYTVLFGLSLLFLVVPPAWCYWLVEKPNRRTAGRWIPPFWGWLATLVASAIEIIDGPERSLVFPEHAQAAYWGAVLVLIVAVETMVWGLLSGYLPRPFAQKHEDNDKLIFDDERLRLLLSLQLRTALVTSASIFGFVLVDSIAQTLYGAALLDQFRPRVWLAGVFGPLVVLAGLARTVVAASSNKPGGSRFRIPFTLLAAVVAFAITGLLLITVDAISYAIAWKGQMPLGPRPEWTISQRLNDARRIEVKPIGARAPAMKSCGAPPVSPAAVSPDPGWQITAETFPLGDFECGARRSRADLMPALGALAITLLLSFLFGWSWPFLNRSTHQTIYTSRLIRAYLGASNPRRYEQRESVSETMPDDDIHQEDYWPRFRWLRNPAQSPEQARNAEAVFLGKRMPLHLVNVTVNETLNPRSRIEQRDRKGTGMAIGPTGISVGVADHLVLGSRTDETAQRSHGQHSLVQIFPQGDDNLRVFRFDRAGRRNAIDFGGEFLTLGSWIGISGAAFSTSLGWRTSLAMSLLAGLANVRLTYWWNAGVKPIGMTARESRWRYAGTVVFESLFAVQKFFLDELLARFRGTARRWWPVSDGGHFENLGGYELVRRRLPVIVIIDAEADPDYTFEGLANLVRKARLDFGAEITFLSEAELDERLDPEVRCHFGTLEQLRRQRRLLESAAADAPRAPQNDGKAGKSSPALKPDGDLSLAHAALAEITYSGQTATSMLVYIKPTLVGDEPADVHRYHTEHPSFPHESTLQQFFDEAQWESYRKLGEHIALKLFKKPENDQNTGKGGLSPHKLVAPAAVSR